MISLYINLPFQTTYSIKTSCKDLVSLLELKYGKYVSVSNINADYKIVVSQHDGIFKIRFVDDTYSTPYPLQEIDRIIFENTKYDNCVFALHGSALEWNSKAYLFLAPTTGGKTTLAAYLSAVGFGYITDDCILLDRGSFNVYPCNTPIHLRGGGLEVLAKYNIRPEIKLLQEEEMKRYIYTPINCVEKETPLAKIFFITRTSCENNLVPMTANEKIAELIKSPLTYYNIDAEYIKFISRLAKAECFRLNYCDMAYVAEVIRNV